MQIAHNSVVSIHYTLTNDGGDVIDSSAGSEPLVYLQGAGNIIPGRKIHSQAKSGRHVTNTRCTG